MRDIKNRTGIVHLLDPQDLVATDTVSSILDTWGWNAAMIAVSVGALTGVDASNHLTPILQESDSIEDTGFTAVAAGSVHGGFTKIDATTKDSVTQVAGYAGSKRYIRVKLDYTGAGITAGVVGVVGILGRPRVAPTTAPAPIAAT